MPASDEALSDPQMAVFRVVVSSPEQDQRFRFSQINAERACKLYITTILL